MVTRNMDERKPTAEYSLRRIHELAAAGKVAYAGRIVERDIENLGYDPDYVARCLQTLNQCHFQESIRYGSTTPWMDVYRTKYPGPKGDLDDLYIKLKLDRDCVLISLNSFHLVR